MEAAESDPAGISASVLKSFRSYERQVSVVNSRRAAILAAVFMMAGATLDIIVFPEHFILFLWIRVACSLLLILVFLDLRRNPGMARASYVAGWIALLPIISICLMIRYTGGGDSIYYAGLNLVLVGLSLLLRWTFRRSAAMTLVCAALYFLSVSLAPDVASFRVLFNNSYFLFVNGVFVIVGSYFYERLRLSEFALRAEVEKSRETLHSQYLRLGELDEAKTRFFANISHELRTPLTIMLGITEGMGDALKSIAKDPKIDEMLHLLGQNGLRLMKLIDDLLDLVRFDTGHADLDFQPTPVKAHFDGLLKSLSHVSGQDGVALLWDCSTDHGSILLDRDKFDKIVLNLVINAIKFTPSGGTIDVSLNVAEGKLELTVQDTGVGIPQEDLGRIFDRFWQVDTSSTRKFQGSGIGLALVRSLAEALGGEVQVESAVGRGTQFTVHFPVAAATALDLRPLNPETGKGIVEIHRKAALSLPAKTSSSATRFPADIRSHTAPHIGARGIGSRPLVLIADDEPDIRRFLIMQLEDVEVIEASDGAEALELAKIHRPQIALLDHMMPELDGVEVCRRIRENHSTRDTFVIVLTARADEQTKLDALRAGASDFLTKPFSTAELGLRLRNQIMMGRFRKEMAEMNLDLTNALETIKENEVLMLRNEKLSALGRMSAGIIHEINNPLNYANAGLHALAVFSPSLPESDRPDFEDILKDIREGVSRVSQIVIDLRQFTRDEKSGFQKEMLGLEEIVRSSIRMIGHQLGTEIQLDFDPAPSPEVNVNSNQIVQVCLNFLQNSIDAILSRAANGTPDYRGMIQVTTGSENGGAVLTFRDNGIGIPPEDIRFIFDPFFTSKEVGQGMGLGLSITHQILRSHEVEVHVDSRPGEFTEIRLVFPAPESEKQSDLQETF